MSVPLTAPLSLSQAVNSLDSLINEKNDDNLNIRGSYNAIDKEVVEKNNLENSTSDLKNSANQLIECLSNSTKIAKRFYALKEEKKFTLQALRDHSLLLLD